MMKIFVFRDCDQVRLIAAGIDHEPDAHLDDDAKGGLGEDAVVVRSEAIVEELPCLVWLLLVGRCVRIGVRIWESAHSGAYEGSVWKDDW